MNRPRPWPALLATSATTVLLTSACATTDGTAEPDTSAAPFRVLTVEDNTAVQHTLLSLSTGPCVAAERAAPIEITSTPQETLDDHLHELAGAGELPAMFPAGNAPDVVTELRADGRLVDIGSELEQLDRGDAIRPAAVSTAESLYGDGLVVLPTELNIEGFWYNQKILDEHGLTPPTTWTELVDLVEDLDGTGVVPLSAAGEGGWPLTRLVGNYAFRSLGPDAMRQVADGDAELTDPAYVEAAAQVAELGRLGAFGDDVGAVDYPTAMARFLDGDAALYYMGSWALTDFNDASRNHIGQENIGFVPFPEVEGGEGDATQLAANLGVPMAMSQAAYDEGAQEWLSCIARYFGPEQLTGQGAVTGFDAGTDATLPPLTTTVADYVDGADTTVLWFEALFPEDAQATSFGNGAPLVSGQLSPRDFMASVQAELG